ncbi:hypothetical protein QYF61_010783, partial [Mycteria americana]
MLAGLDPLVILYMPCDGTQDDLLHQLPWYRGQADRPPVPMLHNPLGEEIFPNTQSKPPLEQLEAIFPSPITCYLGEETDPHLATTSFQTLHQLRCPSLDTLQHLNVCLVVRSPKLNTVFEAAFQPLFPGPVALHGVAVTQVQDRALSLVESVFTTLRAWPVLYPAKSTPIQATSSQFLQENAVGNGVKGLTKVQDGVPRDSVNQAPKQAKVCPLEVQETASARTLGPAWGPVLEGGCKPSTEKPTVEKTNTSDQSAKTRNLSLKAAYVTLEESVTQPRINLAGKTRADGEELPGPRLMLNYHWQPFLPSQELAQLLEPGKVSFIGVSVALSNAYILPMQGMWVLATISIKNTFRNKFAEEGKYNHYWLAPEKENRKSVW